MKEIALEIYQHIGWGSFTLGFLAYAILHEIMDRLESLARWCLLKSVGQKKPASSGGEGR